jgi:hypothetical protein
MGSCISKPPRFVLSIPGILNSAYTAHLLEERGFRRPETLWAKYELSRTGLPGLDDDKDFISFVYSLNRILPLYIIVNCVRFLKDVSNVIERADIRLKIALCIFRDPAAYMSTLDVYEMAISYIQQFNEHVIVDFDNMEQKSGEFIHNVMKYLRTKGARPDVTFNAAFTRMMKERTDKPPPYTYPPGYVHLPQYTELPTCDPPNDPLPEYSVV